MIGWMLIRVGHTEIDYDSNLLWLILIVGIAYDTFFKKTGKK